MHTTERKSRKSAGRKETKLGVTLFVEGLCVKATIEKCIIPEHLGREAYLNELLSSLAAKTGEFNQSALERIAPTGLGTALEGNGREPQAA